MQKFSLQLVSPPATEPVSIAEAKAHLRVDFEDEDDLIGSLISAAREHVEQVCNRVIGAQTWCLSLDQFPLLDTFHTVTPYTREGSLGNGYYFSQCQIEIPLAKVVNVTSITYVDGAGTTQTLSPSSYVADTASEPARIVPANGSPWPYPDSYVPGSIKVSFVAGGDTCPASINQAILLLVGHWYANREAVSEKPMANLPLAVDSLLSPHKFYGLVV